MLPFCSGQKSNFYWQKCFCRPWCAEHFCNLKFTSSSNNFQVKDENLEEIIFLGKLLFPRKKYKFDVHVALLKFSKNDTFRVSSHFWSKKYRIIGIFFQVYRANIGIFQDIQKGYIGILLKLWLKSASFSVNWTQF